MITTKSRYALRAVIDIARHQDTGSVRRSDIARRQEIPRHYLERILLLLKEGGILRSRKGPGGGFVLGRPPDAMAAWDVIEAVGEGKPALECLSTRTPGCRRSGTCETRAIWARLHNVVKADMSEIRLSEILSGKVGARLGRDLESLLAGADRGSPTR